MSAAAGVGSARWLTHLNRRRGDTKDVEENLVGGVANVGEVVRRGEFVLRPTNPYSLTIHGFLKALRRTGFQGASLPVDIGKDCRERLIYIEGDVPVPPFPTWAQSDTALASVTKLISSFHKASSKVGIPVGSWSEEMADPEGGPIICHNDVCLENVVFRDGEAIGLLDFDFAAPGRPIYDLAALALMCVPIDDDLSAERRGWAAALRPTRLRLVADIYGLNNFWSCPGPRSLGPIDAARWRIRTATGRGRRSQLHPDIPRDWRDGTLRQAAAMVGDEPSDLRRRFGIGGSCLVPSHLRRVGGWGRPVSALAVRDPYALTCQNTPRSPFG